MNLGEAKNRALSLMAEYSIDGVRISDGENADYLLRMNTFANNAQMEISEKVGIGASKIYVQQGTSEQGYNRYDLPSDFKQLRRVLYNDEQFTDYRIVNNQILFNKGISGSFEMLYFKNPTEITSETPDTYEFEVDKNTQHIIPYYLGGMAISDENATIGDRLLNLYFNRLRGTEKKVEDHPNSILAIYNINTL